MNKYFIKIAMSIKYETVFNDLIKMETNDNNIQFINKLKTEILNEINLPMNNKYDYMRYNFRKIYLTNDEFITYSFILNNIHIKTILDNENINVIIY